MTERKRIVVISEDLAEPWDEGIKKFTYSVYRALGESHDARLLNVDRSGVAGREAVRVEGSRTFLSREVARALRAHRPDAVLYVPSPSNTTSSYLRCAVLRSHARGAALGMVALIPRRHSSCARPFLRRLGPDMTWVPSYRSLLYLSRLGVRGDVLPVGVDRREFRPPAPGEKVELRDRYGLPRDAFVFLHVGHLSPKRNLVALAAVKDGPGVEVVVIGSTSTPADAEVRRELEARGVRVVRELVNVAEYYRAADGYLFPVEDGEGAVELPLSVVEALASGLPVLATPFGGLPDFFIAAEDVVYWSTVEELVRAAAELRARGPGRVRDMADFEWSAVAGRIASGLFT